MISTDLSIRCLRSESVWGRRNGNIGRINFSSSDVIKDEDEEDKVDEEEGMEGLLSSCNGGDVLPLLLSSDQDKDKDEEDKNGLLSSCNGGNVLPLLLSSDQQEEEEEEVNGK